MSAPKNLKNDPEIKLAFKGEITDVTVTGPGSLYRFAGYREDGGENNPKGSWWFSKETFDDFSVKSQRLNVSFTEFAKYRLALPDSWNDKLHLYALNLPAGEKLTGIRGIVAYQRLNGGSKINIEDRRNLDHIFMIGGTNNFISTGMI